MPSCYIAAFPMISWPEPPRVPLPHLTLVHMRGITARQLYSEMGTVERSLDYPILMQVRGLGWWGNPRKDPEGRFYTEYTSFAYVEGVGKNRVLLDQLRENIISRVRTTSARISEAFRFNPHITLDKQAEFDRLWIPNSEEFSGIRFDLDRIWVCGRSESGDMDYLILEEAPCTPTTS